jgi:two-component system, LytTR family, response regulator
MSEESRARSRPLRVLIVDDEPLARQRVGDMLRGEPDVAVVGEADSGGAAVAAIRELAPDLVFLDVQMPGKTGLDVVREVGPDSMPATIFVTAYDQYALQAFDVAAVDYLVKPFDDERFEQAFRRARRLLALEGLGELREQLLAVLQGAAPARAAAPPMQAAPEPAPGPAPAALPGNGYLDRIAVEMRGKVRVVPVDQIDYIAASGPYAELYVGERRYVIRAAMQTLEERLDPRRFMRVHRSAIVRLDLVETLHRGAGGDYEVQLKGGTRLRVSRSRREALERWLGVSS